MADKKSDDRRRKLLKTIAAGSGLIAAGKSLPDSWSRPVVDSIMLPAHAQTSGRIFTGSGNVVIEGKSNSDTRFAALTDTLIPEAHAQAMVFPEYAGCAIEVDGGFDVWITYLTFPDLPELRELHGIIPATGGDLAELFTDCSGSGNSIYVGTSVQLTSNSITLSPQFYPEFTLYLATSCVEKLTFPGGLCPQPI